MCLETQRQLTMHDPCHPSMPCTVINEHNIQYTVPVVLFSWLIIALLGIFLNTSTQTCTQTHKHTELKVRSPLHHNRRDGYFCAPSRLHPLPTLTFSLSLSLFSSLSSLCPLFVFSLSYILRALFLSLSHSLSLVLFCSPRINTEMERRWAMDMGWDTVRFSSATVLLEA